MNTDHIHRRLLEALDSIVPETLAGLEFTNTPEGYGRAPLGERDGVELVAVRWPAGVSSALHGHGESAALVRVLSGSLVEHRFVANGSDLVYQQLSLVTGGIGFLPPGSFHRIAAAAGQEGDRHDFVPVPLLPATTDALSLHAYSPRLVEPATPVAEHDLERFRAACRRAGFAQELP